MGNIVKLTITEVTNFETRFMKYPFSQLNGVLSIPIVEFLISFTDIDIFFIPLGALGISIDIFCCAITSVIIKSVDAIMPMPIHNNTIKLILFNYNLLYRKL